MRYRRKFGWMILAAIVFAALIITVTMALWNWLVPVLFQGPQITFLQTVGLLILAKILFGFGGRGNWKGSRKHKYDHLNPEEKAAIKRKFMERCGWKTENQEKENSENEGI